MTNPGMGEFRDDDNWSVQHGLLVSEQGMYSITEIGKRVACELLPMMPRELLLLALDQHNARKDA